MGLAEIILLIITGGAGLFIGTNLAKNSVSRQTSRSQSKAEELLDSAEQEAKEILERAKSNVNTIKNKLKNLDEERDSRLANTKKRVNLQEERLNKRQAKNKQKEDKLNKIQSNIKKFEKEYDENNQSIEKELEKKASMNADKAKEKVMKQLDKEFASYVQNYSAKKEMLTKESSAKESIELLRYTLQRYSEPSSVDRLERTVYLPRLADKERLLGRNFENLRYLESKTDVDIIFDDTPKHVTVSCFQLVKQEIARITIMNLIGVRDVNPEVIDKAYEAAVEEMDQILYDVGKEAANALQLENQDPELLKIIGRLKYRTSYGQNILYHSFEIAYFCAMMAAEIGCDVETAKLAGFFHDVGKAIDQEDGRPHDLLSKEILERFGFPWEVVHAAWAHHDAVPQETPEAHLVIAADKLSAGRPGARTETAEQYIERIQALEGIANESEGVKKAYAVSAGREIRVFLDEQKKSDKDMPAIAKGIAHEIEENVIYPGKIKVNLIRSIKASDFANKKAKSKSHSKK